MPTRPSRSIARRSASAFFSPRTLTGPSVTFSRIVLCENRLNDWKTMPTSARSRASALPSAASGWPSSVIRPESIVSSRLIVRHSVDLPDPDGPITTMTSPRLTVRLTSFSTCSWPKCLLTLSSTTSGPEPPPAASPVRVMAQERKAHR